MTRTLFWDAGPGEIRAGLVEGAELAEFRLFRPQSRPICAAGDVYTARLLYKMAPDRAMVELGRNFEALLENAPALPEGHLIAVEIVRPPIPEPGRWKHAAVRVLRDCAARSDIGWHKGLEPWQRALQSLAATAGSIVCPDAQTHNIVRQCLGEKHPPIRIGPEEIEEVDFDSAIQQAVSGEYAITQGAISVERTRAMTLIDIDGSGDPFRLNSEAARAIPKLLRLLDIGGQIGVDFLAMQDRSQRQAIDRELAAASQSLGPHERTAMNGFGFVQIVRPRPALSIPEILCATTPGRMSSESRATALLREAGRSVGHGIRTLVASPAILDCIRQWPGELDSLKKLLGSGVELVSDSAATGYGHVHVQP